IQLVVNYDQVGFRPKLMLLQQALHRSTAQVHKRFWLSQKNLLGTDLRARSKRLALPISDFHVQIAGQTIDREESQIVRRELIFDTRIAETDNEIHALLIYPESNLSCHARMDGRGRCSSIELPYFSLF